MTDASHTMMTGLGGVEGGDAPERFAQARALEQSGATGVMTGCLYGLILLNVVQLAAGFSDVEPHPPLAVLPMIAATAAMGVMAVPMVRARLRLGYVIGILFCLVSMVGMGPHKLWLENGMVIAPVALIGFAAEVTFIVVAVRALLSRS